MTTDTTAAWQARTLGTKPSGDLKQQMRNLFHDARLHAVSDEVIISTLTQWQFKHSSFVEHGEWLHHLIDSLALTVDELRPDHVAFPFIETKGQRKGKPRRGYIENTAALLQSHKVRSRYNLMAHSFELEIPGFTPAVERKANADLHWLRSTAERHGLSKDTVLEHLSVLATEYHPVRDWINAVPWDGTDRLSELVGTIETDDPLAPELIARWLRQCAAAVTGDPGFRPVGVLTFQGPQGCGKTTWCKRLAPDASGWVGIGLNLDPSRRDDVQTITRFWISELGEIDATFKRADLAAIKAFADRHEDVYRSAYARREERVPRRTILFASVNRPDFLADDTGNRRWWTIRVSRCNWDHGIDTQQLWAQVYQQVVDGLPWRIDADLEAQLNDSNRRFEVHDPFADALWDTWKLTPIATDDDGLSHYWRSLSDIVSALPGYSDMRLTKRETNAAARLLRQAGAGERQATGSSPLRFAVVKTWAESHASGRG